MSKPQITPEQKQMLISFLEEHPELTAARFSASLTNSTCKRLWDEISQRLNNVAMGAVRAPAQWRKCWRDMKRNAKKAYACHKKHMANAGGGSSAPTLSAQTIQMLNLIEEAGSSELQNHQDVLPPNWMAQLTEASPILPPVSLPSQQPILFMQPIPSQQPINTNFPTPSSSTSSLIGLLPSTSYFSPPCSPAPRRQEEVLRSIKEEMDVECHQFDSHKTIEQCQAMLMERGLMVKERRVSCREKQTLLAEKALEIERQKLELKRLKNLHHGQIAGPLSLRM